MLVNFFFFKKHVYKHMIRHKVFKEEGFLDMVPNLYI